MIYKRFFAKGKLLVAELKNQSGEGREIGWNFGFFPHIPGYIDYIDPNFYYPYTLRIRNS